MIYFAQTHDNRFVKIGYAADVKKRMDALQTASPVGLKLLAAMPGDHRVERALHERFGWLRERREWFRAHPEIARVAMSAERLTGIAGDDDPFLRYAILEPRLADLLAEAAGLIAPDDPDAYFCANEVFFGYWGHRGRGLKDRLLALVGWYAESDLAELRTEIAYDVCYDRIYDALPNCQACACAPLPSVMP